MSTFLDELSLVLAIAGKDIGDAVKHKGARANLVFMVFWVIFFYVLSTARPWDKLIEAAVYDEGDVSLFEGTTRLSDGYEMNLFEVSSLGQMQRNMRFERWGVVIPPDYNETIASGGKPILTGYVLWRYRRQVGELEALYTEKFSEFLGQPVQVVIGKNIFLPSPDIDTTMVNFHMIFITLVTAVTLVPSLLMEEKLTRTMDALMISPASTGQVVAGKALAGLFYVGLTGGVFFALNWIYIINWPVALLSFLLCAAFSIGIALVSGSLTANMQQMAILQVPLLILLIVPTVFAGFTNLAPGLRQGFSWLPTTAFSNIFLLAMSSYVPSDKFLFDLFIALLGNGLIFALVVWIIKRGDR